MKRLLLSLHVTRWLRVVAVAGVVLASASTTQDPVKGGDSYQTSAASAWCPRC